MTFESKLCPLECKQGFSKIWPSHLVFDQTWPWSPYFKSDLDILTINILAVSWTYDQISALYSVHKVFLRFDLVT